MGLLKKLFGTSSEKELRAIKPIVDKIEALDGEYSKLTDEQLKAKTPEFKQRIANGESLDDILPEAFAACREAAWRVLGMKPYRVQLIGGIILHQGRIAEMKTGEGKTLVATLPAYLNALAGEGVHIVTVNDYLAKRDSEWMGKVYRFLGLTVGLVIHDIQPKDRKASYAADITYGTNNEFGFDYLRDNMAIYSSELVQRGHSFAIVDEVDSILIDEARTPLIISGQGEKSTQLYTIVDQFVSRLKCQRIAKVDNKEEEDVNLDADYVVDEKARTATLTARGIAKAEQAFNIENLADPENTTLSHHINQAIKAHGVMKRDIDYVVKDGQVIIVDEFTGRLMFGRRYNEGLHQAIEAKEHVEVANESKTLATITFQNYFRLYDKLSGMTGTAMTEQEEFGTIYELDIVEIPTNKPLARIDRPDVVYKTEAGKLRAIVQQIEECHQKGQPVLVGTVSIEKSEHLSEMLRRKGIAHSVLNAKNHEKEAEIVAQAGKFGAVTVATNMAGRGTDIMLGGNAEYLARADLVKAGYSDEVIADATGYAETDNEEILAARKLFAEKMAQHKAVIAEEAEKVRAAGGLFIIGTERHESRRIDNQLRGRAGRQGDPGESRFYLSLEDNLLRLFGKERIHKVSEMMMQRGIPDDSPLEDPLVSKVITAAQQQVESMHFASRKNVLEYDDVMDLQRKAIYGERNAILDGKNVCEGMAEFVESMVDSLLEENCPAEIPSDDWDFGTVDAWVESMTGEKGYDSSEIEYDQDPDVLAEDVRNHLMRVFDEKREAVGNPLFEELCTQITLRIMDTHWVAHLTDMEGLKAGIGLRAYGHRDPLVEYKEEAYQAFSRLVDSIYEDSLRAILRLPVESAGAAPGGLSEEDNPFRPESMVYSDSRLAPEASPLEAPDPAGGNPLG